MVVFFVVDLKEIDNSKRFTCFGSDSITSGVSMKYNEILGNLKENKLLIL